jgi:hypothetical protein
VPPEAILQCAKTIDTLTKKASACDNCDRNVVITKTDSITLQTCPNHFTLNRTWTATGMLLQQCLLTAADPLKLIFSPLVDACGNSVSLPQLILVNDDTAPRGMRGSTAFVLCLCLSCPPSPTVCPPPDRTVDCASPTDPSVMGTALASDNCDDLPASAVKFSDEIVPGSCPQNFTIRRTWSASDVCNNTGAHRS